MDLQQKVTIAAQAVNSISRHDDEDAQVRLAMLDEVSKHIDAERAAISKRVEERLAALLRKVPA